MSKIKKGDDVVVIAGKDKGKRGTVVKVFPETCDLCKDARKFGENLTNSLTYYC